MSESSTSVKRLIAVCGKGGVGKTAFTAMSSRVLLESGKAGKLLLIDADPAMGLPNSLGVTVNRTMGRVREEIIEAARRGKKEEKDQLVNMIDYMALEVLNEMDDYALLSMGRTETLGCYCPVNTILRGTIETLSRSFDTILIDGEAGLEQLNRQVMQQVNTLVIISDPTSRGIHTASLIKGMVDREEVIRCERMGLVFNRVQGNEEILKRSVQKIGLEIFGYIPFDENVASHDLIGTPLIKLPASTPALAAVRGIVDNFILP